MMFYKLRWWCASLSFSTCLLFGYYGDLAARWQNLQKLQQEDQLLTKEWQRLKKPVSLHQNKRHAQQKQTDIVSTVLVLSHLHGLQVTALTLFPQQFDTVLKMERAHLRAQADYQHISAFFAALQREPYPLFMIDYTVSLQAKNNVVLDMDLLQLYGRMPETEITVEPLSVSGNPFCLLANPDELLITRSPQKIQTVPIAQLKLVGFIQQGEQRSALIALATGEVVDVAVGAVIGKEGGTVLEVGADKVRLVLQDHRYVELKQ